MGEALTPSNPMDYESTVAGLRWKTALGITLLVAFSSLVGVINRESGFISLVSIPVFLFLSRGWEGIAENVATKRYARDGLSFPYSLTTSPGGRNVMCEIRGFKGVAIILESEDVSLRNHAGIESVRRSMESLMETPDIRITFTAIPEDPRFEDLTSGDRDYDQLVRYVLKDVYYYRIFLTVLVRTGKDPARLTEERVLREGDRAVDLLSKAGFRARFATREEVELILNWSP